MDNQFLTFTDLLLMLLIICLYTHFSNSNILSKTDSRMIRTVSGVNGGLRGVLRFNLSKSKFKNSVRWTGVFLPSGVLWQKFIKWYLLYNEKLPWSTRSEISWLPNLLDTIHVNLIATLNSFFASFRLGRGWTCSRIWWRTRPTSRTIRRGSFFAKQGGIDVFALF